MEKVFNWGMFPKIDAKVYASDSYAKIGALLNDIAVVIARGNGRCYGDSALQTNIFSTYKLNKFLTFDDKSGIITCESGVLLNEILEVIVPKGFFLPVTPGTKFITLGGAIASNIHGKNHHKEGAISLYIQSFELLIESGEIKICSENQNAELFSKTIGGMGLTGIILSVTLLLKPIETSYIAQKSIKAKNINEVIDLFEANKNYTYSVAWIDCLAKGNSLGRSILMLGEHAKKTELRAEHAKQKFLVHSNKQINIPFLFPSFVLNTFSIQIFNFLFYNKQISKEKNNVVHYNPYFYPLDALNNWNRIYGKKGFTQYQFVIPFENGKEGLVKILTKIAASGCGSFLAVLKTFGEADAISSPLSFPMSGFTLALDFKINKKVLNLLNDLDKIVMEYNGRLYLSKDVRMSKDTFAATYKNQFLHSRKFNSLQSDRLEI